MQTTTGALASFFWIMGRDCSTVSWLALGTLFAFAAALAGLGNSPADADGRAGTTDVMVNLRLRGIVAGEGSERKAAVKQ